LLDGLKIEVDKGGDGFGRQQKRRLFFAEFSKIKEKPVDKSIGNVKIFQLNLMKVNLKVWYSVNRLSKAGLVT
jgi:hypothetical protein